MEGREIKTYRGLGDGNWLAALFPNVDRLRVRTREFSYVSHVGPLVMGHPALTMHHMVWT